MSKFVYLISLFSLFLTFREIKANNNNQKKYELYLTAEKAIPFDKKNNNYLPYPIIQKKLANIKWNIFDDASKNNNLIWEFISPEETTEYKLEPFSEINILKKIEEDELNFNLTQLGISIPTASTFKSGYWNTYFDQVLPLSKGEAGGSGNQNYSLFLNYGFKDDLLTSFYFAINDDPLHKKLNGFTTQPANLWLSLGSSLKWKFYEDAKFSIALDTSLENWRVKSGGCNSGIGFIGSDCQNESPNIFNNSNSPVVNNNLIGSIAIPFTFTTSNIWQHTIVPRITFLPNSQGNENGSGEFYGNNYGIGYGLAYKPYKKLKLFSSFYFPLFNSQNSFDTDLKFNKNIISTIGFNYSFDTKIGFEGYLTNSFGSTPSTAILTIPSSNELVIGGRVVYTPGGFDGNFTLNPSKIRNLFSSDLSLSNSLTIGYQKLMSEFNFSNNDYWTRLKFGLSPSFDMDVSWEGRGDKYYSNENESNYLTSNSNSSRIGGKVLLIGDNSIGSFNTALRLSLGRKVFSDNWRGYFYSELANSYHLNERLTLNINPKLASGESNIYALGLGSDLEILDNSFLKLEYNLPLEQAEENLTFSIGKKTNNFITEIYTSNAFSFVDMGQMLQSSERYYGIKITKFL